MKSDFEKMQNTEARDWISQEDIASLLPDTDIAITRGSANIGMHSNMKCVVIFSSNKKILNPLKMKSKKYDKTLDPQTYSKQSQRSQKKMMEHHAPDVHICSITRFESILL